jgi:hypothetical protein
MQPGIHPRSRLAGVKALVFAALAIGAGAYIYKHFSPLGQFNDPSEASRTDEPDAASNFKCDGRTRCSQMTSCTEAKWFLEHCPGVEMDGDHDGVPCEQQWCTSESAR